MLMTLPLKQTQLQVARWVGVVIFCLLTVISARLRVELGLPVPFTLQVLTIILAGLVLGSRDGAISQIAYLSLIALNMPVDTRMMGAAAFAGPTAGFLVGFPVMAFVAGWLAERGGNRLVLRWLAGIVATVVLYLFGATWLKLSLSMTWAQAWAAAAAPFILMDLLKALIAAALAEGGRAVLFRINRW